jgi:hypothetical protein
MDNTGWTEVTYHSEVIAVKAEEGFVQGNIRAVYRSEETIDERSSTPFE